MRKNKKINDKDRFKHLAANSATECTGLIIVPPSCDEEYESYNEIYNFIAPVKREKAD